MHTKAERLHQNFIHAKRRMEIFIKNWRSGPAPKPLNYYSKNKVHCSCPMCSGYQKTNSDVVKNNWKHSDKKKRLKNIELE